MGLLSLHQTRETEAERTRTTEAFCVSVHVYSGVGHFQTGDSQRSGVFWGSSEIHLWSVIPCPVIMKTPLTLGRLLRSPGSTLSFYRWKD